MAVKSVTVPDDVLATFDAAFADADHDQIITALMREAAAGQSQANADAAGLARCKRAIEAVLKTR